jgi:hypothetical protein
MMMGKGEQWEANNYIKLTGDAVKNGRLIDSITGKLRTLNVQFER